MGSQMYLPHGISGVVSVQVAFSLRPSATFLVFCWLLIALTRDPGKGTLNGLQPYLPLTLKYWTTLRMLRSAQWDARTVLCQMVGTTRWAKGA